MPRWEYEIQKSPLSREQLNALGVEGWELAGANDRTFVFKRQVEAGAPEDPSERARRARAELQAIRGS